MINDEIPSPNWEDYEEYWDASTHKERIKYITECLGCEITNPIAESIAKQYWEIIPETIQEMIEGDSQFGNDVLDKFIDMRYT